jgi:hypothetical protein
LSREILVTEPIGINPPQAAAELAVVIARQPAVLKGDRCHRLA